MKINDSSKNQVSRKQRFISGWILENNDFPFVAVALRAASILKNRVFCIYCISPKVQNAEHLYSAGFEPQEHARTVSFEKWCRMQ